MVKQSVNMEKSEEKNSGVLRLAAAGHFRAKISEICARNYGDSSHVPLLLGLTVHGVYFPRYFP